MNIKKLAQKLNLPESLAEVAVLVDQALTQAGIPHGIIGGIAVGKYSNPRTTKDIDFLINHSDLSKIKKLYKTTPLLMETRDGVSTNVNGYDVDFIVAHPEESFLLTQPEDYAGLTVPGKNNILYLKLTSGRSGDLNDVIQMAKKMSSQERQNFVTLIESLEVPGLDLEDMKENFESCCQIADLEQERENKKAGKEFKKLVLKKIGKTK